MKVTIKYGTDNQTKTFVHAPTIRQIKDNDSLKAALGFGDNVRALVNGVEVPDSATCSDGMIVILETACNTKAAPDTLLVKYGADKFEFSYEPPMTVGQLKTNSRVRAALGFGDNVRVMVNGIVQPDNATLPETCTVIVETACNMKAKKK